MPGTKANTRRSAVRHREAMCAQLSAQGWSVARIGVRLAELEGLSEPFAPQRVRQMLQRQRERTEIVGRTYSIDAAYQQLAQLEYIVEEAMEAWRQSKEPSKTATKSVSKRPGRKGSADSGPPPDESAETTSTTVNDQDGNTAYLSVAMQAMERMGKLMGWSADRPILQVNVGSGHGSAGGVSFDEMSEGDVQRYLATLGEAALLVAGPKQLPAPSPDSVIDMPALDAPVVAQEAPSDTEGDTDDSE